MKRIFLMIMLLNFGVNVFADGLDDNNIRRRQTDNVVFAPAVEVDYTEITNSFTKIFDNANYLVSLISIINDTDSTIYLSFGTIGAGSASVEHVKVKAGRGFIIDLDTNTVYMKKSIWIKYGGSAPTSGTVDFMIMQ